jgi:hypothetical protein
MQAQEIILVQQNAVIYYPLFTPEPTEQISCSISIKACGDYEAKSQDPRRIQFTLCILGKAIEDVHLRTESEKGNLREQQEGVN